MRRHAVLMIVCLSGLGCVTTPAVGSRVWHEERTIAIDEAYNAWEISEEEYLVLKHETDQMRSEYLNRLEERRRRNLEFGIGYGFYGHPHFGGIGFYPHW